MTFSRKNHWEKIYQTKELTEVSWYQNVPKSSLEYIHNYCSNKEAQIIDVGGGDSFLVDNLLKEGYQNISVLDISEKAIERAKKRLGKDLADKVNWIHSDIVDFKPEKKYDLWHDRAAFHFLTAEDDLIKYKSKLTKALLPGSRLVIASFSENGPKKCSGIDIKQYSLEDLKNTFVDDFKFLHGENIDHPTPFDTVQNFSFAAFDKI